MNYIISIIGWVQLIGRIKKVEAKTILKEIVLLRKSELISRYF